MPELPEAIQTTVPALPAPSFSLRDLFPLPAITLTAKEQESLMILQTAQAVLGPTSATVATCPADSACPQFRTCPLLKMGKAPKAELCPIEASYIVEKFQAWVQSMGLAIPTLPEERRAVISELVALDIEEMRLRAQLADPENISSIKQAVHEVDVNGKVLAWEDKLNPVYERLGEISRARARLLDSQELTPLAQSRKARLMGGGNAQDLSTAQAKAAERLRKVIDAGTVIEQVEPKPEPVSPGQ